MLGVFSWSVTSMTCLFEQTQTSKSKYLVKQARKKAMKYSWVCIYDDIIKVRICFPARLIN